MASREKWRVAEPWAVLLLALATACGGSSEPAETDTRVATGEWRVVSGAWPEPTTTRAGVLEIPRELGPDVGQWLAVPADRAEVAPVEGTESGAREVRLTPYHQPVVLRARLAPETENFDLVRLALHSDGYAEVFLHAELGDGLNLRSESIVLDRSPEVQHLEFDFAALNEHDKRPGVLSLRFPAYTHTLRVRGVEFWKRNAASRLPSPSGLPVHVGFDSASRPAVGVLPEVTLEARFDRRDALRVIVPASRPSGSTGSDCDLHLSLLREDEVIAQATVVPGTGWEEHELRARASDDGEEPLRLRAVTDCARGVLLGRPVAVPDGGEAAPSPRTVLLVTSDTHRADHVGYAHDGVGVATPTIDALGEAGVRFDDATSSSSLTNPSHAAILTGLSVRDTGVAGNLAPLSDRATTLAERFRDAGFRTFAATSVRHLAPSRSGFGQGFERFDAPRTGNQRDAAETIAVAREFLAEAEGQDLFLWLHLFDAHGPYEVRACCTDAYYSGDPYDEEVVAITEPARPRWDRKIRDEAYVHALYKGEVTYLDRALGDFLDEAPRLREGWIAFTADHGESLGEHGLYWLHSGLYPSTLNVPLVLSGPGVEAGRRVARPVGNLDVGRTLLELAGAIDAEDRDAYPGRSLLDPERFAEDDDAPRFAIGQGGTCAGVFHDGWYLLLYLQQRPWGNPVPGELHAVELYDLRRDPRAANNVVTEHRERARRLREALVRWLTTEPSLGVLVDEETTSHDAIADVAALGYATDESGTFASESIDPECRCDHCESWR